MARFWHVHFQGETLGPLSTEKVLAMLAQNRLQFTDFAWRSGLTKWMRMSELDDFIPHLPAYPTTPIPERDGNDKEQITAPLAEPIVKKKSDVKEAKKPKIKSAFLRIPLEGTVKTTQHGSFAILNAAERGVFVSADTPLPLGTEMKFTLTAKAFPKPLEMTGVVVRQSSEQEEKGFAIEFTRINPAHKRLFEEYVRAWIEK